MTTKISPSAATRNVASSPIQRDCPGDGSPGRGTGGDITLDRIRGRAYEVFQTRTRDGVPGDANSDWLQAGRVVYGVEAGARCVRCVGLMAAVGVERVLAL